GQDKDLGKLGRYYGACMDEEGIERNGTTPLAPLLSTIAAVNNADDFLAFVGQLHRINVDALFDVEVDADFKDPNTDIAFFNQGGLGLPDRDYYLKDDEQSTALRGQYQAHVARMLALLGESADDSVKHAAQ